MIFFLLLRWQLAPNLCDPGGVYGRMIRLCCWSSETFPDDTNSLRNEPLSTTMNQLNPIF